MKSFLLKLNIRQLIIHFIASWFFIYAFYTLTSLYDYKFLYNDFAIQNRMLFKYRFSKDFFIFKQGGNLGLIIAYVISWQISERRKWFWANSVIVLLVSFTLYYFDLLGWKNLMTAFLTPGQLIFDNYSMASVITNGVIMLAAGVFLLLKKQVIDFIDRGVKRDKKARKK
jgi:hypothetical protein